MERYLERHLESGKRTVGLAVILCVLLAAALLASAPVSQAAAQSWHGKSFGSPVDLGVPTYSISINDAVFGKEDGREVYYSTVSSNNAVFNVVDVRDNKLLRSFELTGVAQSWRHAIAPDGTVYIAGITSSNRGELWSYSPSTKTVQKLGEPIPGEKSLWSMTVDEEGNIYGGTFQSGKVFRYDPVARTFRDYGTMVPGQEYVRSMAYYKGFLYAGIGSVGQVVKLNVMTGEKTVISQDVPGILGVTPDKVPFAYDMAVVDGTLLVRFSYDTTNELLFYDLEKQQWVNKKVGSVISGETGIGVFGFNQLTSLDGKLYIVGNRKLVKLDMNTFEAQSTSISFGSSLRGAEWIEFTDDPAYPGKSLVTSTSNGKLVIINVKDGRRKDLPAVVKGAPNPLHNLEQGPDGKLYMSGYPGGIGAQYDPKTGTKVNFTLGQSEGMVGLGDYMYYGVYPGAIIYRSKLSDPVPAVEQVFQIGSDQDRPYVMIAADNKLFIGTIPGYGKLGGALTIYDPATGVKKVYTNIVHNQSITGLAYRDGILYGSTNVYGGLGIEKTETKAKMFVWDVAQEKKLAEFTLDLPELDKPPMITGLTFGPDGLLWGNVDGIVFKMNPDTYQIAGYKDIYPSVNNYGFWRPYHPHWSKDGLLYVDLADIITVVDPVTMDFVQLSPTGKEIAFFNLAEDESGNESIYYTDGANLMKIPVAPDDTGSGAGAPAKLQLNMQPSGSLESPLEVRIVTEQTDRLYGAKAVLQYDPAYFSVKSVESGFAAGQGFFTWKDDGGKLTVLATHTGSGQFRDGDLLARVVLEPAGKSGRTELTLLKNSELVRSDADQTRAIFNPEAAIARFYELLKYRIEDVNQDGTVDVVDMVTVAKMVGKAPTGELQSLDVNRDGVIDISDLALLAMVILK
ncbi:hypothetical protein SAMN02799630_04532 [Paenibacillus sp. UNCCL117]|uniref:dockerin type I domain-containing protein n=1 Tax=unclassified Paenibacillus TaxID=185978 RepID=UPI000891D0FE|nr:MULTISPECIES: dockerin type I domain-containing protein [unclassified Paenibacillus]SDD65277.1 hypothetical protein SAMN04488602_111108 [Paenibacillus sp. cl123]SFW58153.1 hypothetical protein SAMN02799630_04532 [Paenibacillus sp. UNCCL117]